MNAKTLKKNKKFKFTKIISHIILAIGGFVMLYPLIFIVMASFFTVEEFNTTGLSFFPIAQNPTLENFQALFFASADKYTLIYYTNSIIRTLYGTFFRCLTALLAGYVFARLKFKGKDILFMVLLATQMIPSIVGTLPMYVQMVNFPFFGDEGIYNTWGVYLLLDGPVINIMGMFLVKQAIEATPEELVESAKIDGAGTFTIIFRIMFPLVKTVMAFIAITSAIGIWNDWTVPFYYTDSRNLQTIASAISRLTSFANQEGSMINYPAILAFSLMLTVPSVIIFAIFQKWIIEGVANAGIKG